MLIISELKKVNFLLSSAVQRYETIGKLSEIVSLVYRKNENASITATAVSVETLAEATDAFKKAGRECSITQIAVTRMKKVGSYTMPDAMNPVWIISGGKKCSE